MHLRVAALLCLMVFGISVRSKAIAQEPAKISTYQTWVTSLAFVPGKPWLATSGGQSLQFRPGEVQLWSLENGELLRSFPGHTANVWTVAVSPNGKWIASGGYNGRVLVHEVETGAQVAAFDKPKGWVRTVCFAPDSSTLVAGAEDGSLQFWKTEGGFAELKTVKAHDAAVYQVAFSADGNTLGTASVDKTSKLWDWRADKEKAKLATHTDAVWTIAFSSAGLVATAGADRKIKLWNLDGAEQATLEGHRDWVSSVAFSGDGSMLASASHDKTLRIWNVAQRKEIASLGPWNQTLWTVAFAPQGNVVAAGSHGDSLRLWEMAFPKPLFAPEVK
jgi:WD40 repeat protein